MEEFKKGDIVRAPSGAICEVVSVSNFTVLMKTQQDGWVNYFVKDIKPATPLDYIYWQKNKIKE